MSSKRLNLREQRPLRRGNAKIKHSVVKTFIIGDAKRLPRQGAKQQAETEEEREGRMLQDAQAKAAK